MLSTAHIYANTHTHPPAWPQGLVLQYRALQNVRTKWLQPDWLPLLVARSGGLALPGAGGGGSGGGGQLQLPRLSCSWNQTQTATGRLSSSSPNLQASRCCRGADGPGT